MDKHQLMDLKETELKSKNQKQAFYRYLQIAEHHKIHLEEFILREKLDATSGIESINDSHCIAFIIVNKDKMISVRDALRPQRGEVS